MSKESKELVVSEQISKFQKAFQAGIEGIVEACEVYVKAIDDNPANADKFREHFADTIPASAWASFEAVGRKWMHPRLILGGVSDRKKNALIKKLPYSLQERIFKRERFPLLLDNGHTLEIDIMEATPEQAEQLCDGPTIRTTSAQKAWKEARPVEAEEAKAETLPYRIADGKIIFRRNTTLTRQELKRIVAEM
jgi:hypothetical protein